MPFADLPTGARLFFLDPFPQGRPGVLLLHGLGATSASWAPQLSALVAAGYRPLAPDLRGFGRSSFPGSWSLQAVAQDLDALLTHLQLSQVHVVGISMGGVVAQVFALVYPRRVRSLVLVNTFARLRARSRRHLPYLLIRFVLVWLLGPRVQAGLVARRIFPRPEQAHLRAALQEQLRQAHPRAYRSAMLALARFDATPHLSKLTMPTLVVTGQQDTTVPPEVQQVLVQGLPQVRQHLFAHAGHGLSAEIPEAFNRVLLDFLREVDAVPSGASQA